MLAASTLQFTHKNHLTIQLLDRYVVILDALEVLLHLVQLVVVGGKEGTCTGFGVFVDILHNGPSD